MAHMDLIDSLIATYRTLNMRVRPLDPATAGQLAAGGTTLRSVIADMRNQELTASQTLKNMTLSDTSAGGISTAEVDILPPSDEENVRVLLSEFGTAREAILALIRELSDEQWETERPGASGPTTVLAYVQALTQRDQQVLSQLDLMIPVATAS
jgi:hypothetical protein